VDNIRMDLQEVGCGHVDWIGLAQDRDRWRTLVSAVMNLQVPWNAGNFLTSCKPVSFSGRTLHRGVSKYRTTTAGYRGVMNIHIGLNHIGTSVAQVLSSTWYNITETIQTMLPTYRANTWLEERQPVLWNSSLWSLGPQTFAVESETLSHKSDFSQHLWMQGYQHQSITSKGQKHTRWLMVSNYVYVSH